MPVLGLQVRSVAVDLMSVVGPLLWPLSNWPEDARWSVYIG